MSTDLPDEAFACALASVPGYGPAALRELLRHRTPRDAWMRVARAEPLARAIDVDEMWRRANAASVGVMVLGAASYPHALAGDMEPPAVLFARGDPSVISGPRVAIVGTRDASRYGLDLAYELGRDLAAAGVAVVSGLALGIDGAAHAGALDADTAPPIAVVGSGLDVVYPRRHESLWRAVERSGVVLSEAPLGAPPERWRFPARNRIIAALADAIVVVESREAGGSMHTVAEGQRRDRPVLAAPGPVRSPTSAGTPRLMRAGAHVVCDATDVLLTLGLTAALTRPVHDPRPEPDPADRAVLEAVGWSPVALATLATRVPCSLGELVLALGRLGTQGWLVERGGWFERVARSDG